MTRREKTVWLLLCSMCILSLAVPVNGLFLDGVYSWHIRQPEFLTMILETAGLALIWGAVWLFVEQRWIRVMATAVVCLAFVWCHVVFLPMLVSGIYLIYVYLVGYTIRTRLIRSDEGIRDGWLWDFVLGWSAVMILFSLMSVIGIGGIGSLKAATAGIGIGVILCSGRAAVQEWKNGTAGNGERHRPCGNVNDTAGNENRSKNISSVHKWQMTKFQAILLVFMIVMVAIQVGRMGISLDFDSLWYGVRSEYILDNGRGIYENMGSVGLVYTYPKGLEVLLLPLSNLASHSYLIFFNIWMAVLSLMAVYKIGRFYMGRTYSMLAAACVSSIPAVMNMSITAKTDTATLFIQLVMVLFMLHYLREKEPRYLFASLGAFFLSWTLKPTAVVFSTAVFGMSVLYLLGTRQFVWKAPGRVWLSLLIPFAALAAIWGRTMIMVGIPVTSVFSSIFLKLGFQLKYPFSVLPLNGSSVEEGSIWGYLAETLYRMALNPSGEDMNHVVIAWGTSLVFFLTVTALLLMCIVRKTGKTGRARTDRITKGSQNNWECIDTASNLTRYAHTVMIPFVAVCLISLLMLGQIDGNYFMLLDVFLVLYACAAISRMGNKTFRKRILILMFPILLLNVPVTMVSNWAWSLGYTPVNLINKGRINHRELQHQEMISLGNSAIWDILAADPATRVIAAGNHPQVFNFPCNVQSYDDITSSWGNVRLVKTMDDFIGYLTYAKTDYIYMQAGTVDAGSRCHELMGYLIEAGILTDVFYENGNLLARVDLHGGYSLEATAAYECYKTDYPAR